MIWLQRVHDTPLNIHDGSVCEVWGPKTHAEVDQDQRWVDAMKEETQALIKNNTWELVPLSAQKKTIGCRWVYKVKHNDDETVNRYKARLIATRYVPNPQYQLQGDLCLGGKDDDNMYNTSTCSCKRMAS